LIEREYHTHRRLGAVDKGPAVSCCPGDFDRGGTGHAG